jgi:S-adenosylmethionine hydrolase
VSGLLFTRSLSRGLRNVPIITLLTDFQDGDGFSGVVKGVLAGIAPQARLIDLAHGVPPGDVPHAAFVLRCAYRFFPPGTIHLAVVDPGVGGPRRALAVQALGQFFVAPDNGLLAWVLHELAAAAEPVRAWSLTDPRFRLGPLSATFHGRDLFAPAAAFLADGIDPTELGPQLKAALKPAGELESGPVGPLLPQPGDPPGTGRVVHVDTFGNAVTSIPNPSEGERDDPDRIGGVVETATGPVDVFGPVTAYTRGPPGRAVLVPGSSGWLEIAVSGGSAVRLLGIERGAPVRLVV